MLAVLAAVALDKIGGTYASVAGRLGVSPSYISDAVNKLEVKLTELRLRSIALSGYDAEGPLYRLKKAEGT